MARRGGTYRYTPKRRAALKKAQLLSARKRRGKKIAIGAGAVGVGVLAVGGGVLAAKHIRGTRAGKKNIITHNPAPVRAVSGSSVATKDIVAHPPTVRARPNKLIKSRGPLYEYGDLSHVSSVGKNYREDIKNKTGNGASGSPASKGIGYGHYPFSDKHLDSIGTTSSTNPMVRMIMGELKKDEKYKRSEF